MHFRLELMLYSSRRIAGAKLQMRCAVFLRNAKRLAEIYGKKDRFSATPQIGCVEIVYLCGVNSH